MSAEMLQILLIEDTEAHVELIRRAFMPEGKKFNLTIAGTLAEARKTLKETSPDLMIVDYKLPDGKGTELLPGDVGKLAFPIVMLSGHGDEKIATAAMKAGAIDYIVKSDKTLADMPHITERILREWQHITERKNTEIAFQVLLKGAAGNSGEEFFKKIVHSIATWLHADCVILGGFDDHKIKAYTMVLDGQTVDEFSYTLTGSPCENAANKGFCAYQEGVIKKFPDDRDLVKLGAEGYVGVSLKDREGHAIGILCAIFKSKASFPPRMQEVFEIIAGRASIEIERKQAEKALRESEKRYRTLFESTTDAIMLLDEKGFFDCNEATLRMFGCKSQGEFLNKHPAELSPPRQPCGSDSMKLADEHIAVAFKQGSKQFEWMHRRIDGTEFSADVLLTAMKLDGKKVLQATVRNISERKQFEMALNQMEAKHQKLIDSVTALPWTYDLTNDRYIFVGKQIKTMLGIHPDAISNMKDWVKLIHPDDRRRTVRFTLKQMNQEDYFEIEHRMKLADGRWIWVRNVISVEMGENGPVSLSGFMFDITRRKQFEDALHFKQGQLQSLLDVSRQINTSLEKKGIRKALLGASRSLTNSTSALVGLVEDGRIVFREHSHGGQCDPVDYTFEPGYGVPGHVMQTLKPYISNDAEHDAHTIPKIIRELNVHQLLDVPILNRSGKQLGCFEIHNRKDGRPFDDTDVEILEGLAASAAVALENAQLFSELEQTEKKIQAEQKQTRQIIDTAHDAFIRMDADGIITDWNPQAEEMFGWRRDEALGQEMVKNLVPQEFREAHAKGLKHYLATGEGPVLNQHIEITALHRDGHSFPVELSIASVSMGNVVSFSAFIRDISARQQAQIAMKENHERLRMSLIGTIVAVSRAVGARDPYTAGHQQRVARLARCIAQEMGLDGKQIEGLRMGATIHDIGKIHLPAEILSKPGKLSDMEFELIKTHAQVGYDILKGIEFPWPIADIAHQHHERIDGTGYPRGLKGDEICLEARIVAVADVVEAMSSHRPYRPALGIDAALEEIKSHRGQWYEPAAVDACLKLFREKKFSFD